FRRVLFRSVETYGCQMNISDGELMQGILAAQGYELAERPEDADVILVNRCAIREHAEQRVLGRVAQLNRLKRQRPDLIIGVTGCMAQRMGETLLEKAPYVDVVMGPAGYRRLPEGVAALRRDEGGDGVAGAVGSGEAASRSRRALPVLSMEVVRGAGEANRITVLDFAPHENYEGLEVRRQSRVSAWVPVQRGCDYRCTYCIVPYVRGPE